MSLNFKIECIARSTIRAPSKIIKLYLLAHENTNTSPKKMNKLISRWIHNL